MQDPFQILPSSPRGEKKKADPGPLVLELDADGNGVTGGVSVPCVCGTSLTRALYPPYDWVHEGDEVIIRGGVVIQGSAFDHLPVPDVIDL